jgi:hypothetical protein
MTVEEFQSTTADQLREKANDCFARADKTGSLDRPGLFMEAQFYLGEIERREHGKERAENAKIADRDYKLEKWVIVLIGIEIFLSVVGLILSYVEGAKQMDALNSLNQSTATTATNVSHLAQAQAEQLKTQRSTLDAMQNQLEILRQDQKQRLAGMTKQPVLRVRSRVRESTATNAKYEIVLENSSGVPAKDFVVYFETESTTVRLSIPESQQGGSPNQASIYIPLLGPGLKQAIMLNVQYPAGISLLHVRISSSGENIPFKNLGDLLIKPPAQ